MSPSFHSGKAMEPTQLIGGIVETLQLDQAIPMEEIERPRTLFQRARRNTGCTLCSPLNLLNTRKWLASKGVSVRHVALWSYLCSLTKVSLMKLTHVVMIWLIGNVNYHMVLTFSLLSNNKHLAMSLSYSMSLS